MIWSEVYFKNKSQREIIMIDDEVTMSIRKFLKKVGITSQQEIEKVYSGAGKVKVKMVLSCEELNLEHVIEGEIGKD
mgnify:CR=1 FL=1